EDSLLVQRATLTQQFHHGDHHIEHRPRRGQNNQCNHRHFPGPFPCSLDTEFASQIVKIPESVSVFPVVRRRIAAVPLAKTRMEKVVRVRKLPLTARGRTPGFHNQNLVYEPPTMIPRSKKESALKITFRSRQSSETLKYCKLKPNLAIVTGCARILSDSPTAPPRC